MEFFNSNEKKNNMEIQVKALEKIKVDRDKLLQNLKQQDEKYWVLKEIIDQDVVVEGKHQTQFHIMVDQEIQIQHMKLKF